MSVIEIPKFNYAEEADRDVVGKPCWFPVRKELSDGQMHYVKPHIRCNCGQITGIGLHKVAADGTVTASFYHAKTWVHPKGHTVNDPSGCEWHVWLKLKDYTFGTFLPENK